MSASNDSISLTPNEGDAASLLPLLQKSHETADRLCKHVQAFREQAGIPAINEMRYAGYHVTLALGPNGQTLDVGHLRKAIGHNQRAAYEAAEAGILHCLTQINDFKKDYALVPISGTLSNWTEILTDARAAQSRLGVPRQTGDERHLDHEEHVRLFDRLAAACNDCDIARDELNKGMRIERKGFNRWALAMMVTLLALLVAIFGAARHWNDGASLDKPPLMDQKPRPL